MERARLYIYFNIFIDIKGKYVVSHENKPNQMIMGIQSNAEANLIALVEHCSTRWRLPEEVTGQQLRQLPLHLL
jgi:hypothetical protein